MLRILFFSLCFFQVVLVGAQTNIEIFADGHRYDSFKDYQDSKKHLEVLSKQAKTATMSPATQHRLYVMSVEKGVVGALEDFYEQRSSPAIQLAHRVTLDQMQEAIQEAVTSSKGPKLLISQPGKIRIMALTTK